MPGEKYTVEGEIRLRAEAGVASIRRLADRLGALQSSVAGTQSLMRGLVGGMVSLGAGYVGINALTSAFRGLVGGAVAYQQELAASQIGLASVMGAVEQIPFEQAQGRARALFEQIRTDALTSTATTQELFSVFQGIYGPLANAGLATDEIRTVMRDTVSAANAFGIDLAQANRDIQAMARGAAGVDVRLFSMLRSTGAIAQDTEAFNNLTQTERIDVLRRALGQFSAAAEAYGQSFAGVTSTFRDIVETLTGAFFGPSFERLRVFLSRTNDMLLANREGLESALSAAGERVAATLDRIFRIVTNGMRYVSEHWDQIHARGEQFVARLREVVPQIVRAAQAFAAIQVGRSVLATGLGVASTGASLAGFLGEMGTGLLGGGGAAAAGGGAAAAGTAGGGLAALESAIAAVGAVAAPIAIIIGAVASVGFVVYERFADFLAIFDMLTPVLDAIWADFLSIGSSLWDILAPILRILGTSLLVQIGAAFFVLVAVLRVVVRAIAWVLAGLARFANVFNEWVVEPIMDFIARVARGIAQLVGSIETGTAGTIRIRQGMTLDDSRDPLDVLRDAIGDGTGMQFGRFEVPPSQVPADRRPVQHNDFRGSRITVHQEFRQADPDRVMMQMIEDLNRQAEARIQSGFAPALTR